MARAFERGASRVTRCALLGSLVAGCATSALHVTEPTAGRLREYPSLALTFTSALPDTSFDVTYLQSLQNSVISSLHRQPVFSEIYVAPADGTTPAALRLIGTVVRAHAVDRGARIIGGALAGPTEVELAVVLVDAAAGKTVGSFTVTGKSRGKGIFSSGNEVEDALGHAAEAIVDYLARER